MQQTGAGGIKPEPVVQVTHSSEEGRDWKLQLMELAKVCHVEIIVSLAKVGISFIPRPHLENQEGTRITLLFPKEFNQLLSLVLLVTHGGDNWRCEIDGVCIYQESTGLGSLW